MDAVIYKFVRLSSVVSLALMLSHIALAAGPLHREMNPQLLAREVTIYRDVYGVPHVFGRTDASTVFGFAYAQAEDNFWRIEDNYIRSIGRSSEVYGEETLNNDRLNHALEIPRLAREEYARLVVDSALSRIREGAGARVQEYDAQ